MRTAYSKCAIASETWELALLKLSERSRRVPASQLTEAELVRTLHVKALTTADIKLPCSRWARNKLLRSMVSD